MAENPERKGFLPFLFMQYDDNILLRQCAYSAKLTVKQAMRQSGIVDTGQVR
jgi:hypothetical protein